MHRFGKTVTVSAGIMSAALTGLLTGCQNHSGTDAGSSMNSQDLDKHSCKGQNACKGHGGCKTGDQGCKGKNSCKGNGGCNTMEPPK